MRTLPLLAAPVLYLVSCLGLDALSHINSVPPLHITHWNPASALGLVLLFKYGLRGAPALFLAALIAEMTFRGAVASFPYLLLSSSVIAVGYCCVAAFLTRVAGFDPAFRRVVDLGWFVAATLLGTLVVSTAYVGIFVLAGTVGGGEWGAGILGFWFDEFIGILVLTPLILVHWDFRQQIAKFRPTPEHLLQATSVGLGLWSFHAIGITDSFLLLPLIWVGLRHGIRGTTIVVLATQVGLVLALNWSVHRDWSVAEFHFLMASFAITGLALGLAISERQSVAARLHERDAELGQVMRVVGAGELASSLAHELNQPLSAAQNYVKASRMILERHPPDLKLLGETLGRLQVEVGRAGEAVRNLRGFFQTGQPKTAANALRAMVDECLHNLGGRLTRHRVAVTVDLPDTLPLLRVDQMQIMIVLHNLIGNAIDAIGQADTPRREIVVSAVAADPGWIRVCVADSGPGLSAASIGKLFASFATTKPDGMGLGLLISRSLVEAHGGKLWLDSGEAPNARFCFTLPIDAGTDHGQR